MVDVVIQLIAADHVLGATTKGRPNVDRPGRAPFSKLSDDDLERVRKFAKYVISEPKDMLLYLYYGGCDSDNNCIAGMTVLKAPSLSTPQRGCFNFTLQVSYALTGPVPRLSLKKQVKRIFDHWKSSGDVTYRILSFQVRRDAGVYVNEDPRGHPLY